MNSVTERDKLFFFERHFFTLDGLWMIEAEKKLGWDLALKIDTIVWEKLLKIIIRRLSEYLGLKDKTISTIVKILTFRWTVEGWKFDYNIKNKEIEFRISKCPYKSAMDRNPKRHDRIPLICRDMCIPFYKHIINEFNPDIKIQREKYMGLGDNFCNFVLSYKSNNYDLSGENIEPIKKMNEKDKLFYFERNFKTMDGLWIIEVENQTDFKTSIEMDTLVWQRLYQIIFRRVKRYLKIKSNDLNALVKLLSFIWSCEGYSYEIREKKEKEIIMEIQNCPYEEAMRNNPERQDKIDSICKNMCVHLYEPALNDFNQQIELERKKFLGVGDEICDFHFRLEV
ncbi:MAG: DUF6125 family protein [Promethearchaeati archaeon]